jgi:hypothetical protein
MEIHEIRYGRYATGDHSKLILLNFLHAAKKMWRFLKSWSREAGWWRRLPIVCSWASLTSLHPNWDRLTWRESDKSNPHPPTTGSILIVSSHLLQLLPSCHFPSYLPLIILYAFHISPMGATCPVHLILLDWMILRTFGEEFILWCSSLSFFSGLLSLHPSWSKYSPKHSFLKHPQSVFFP